MVICTFALLKTIDDNNLNNKVNYEENRYCYDDSLLSVGNYGL